MARVSIRERDIEKAVVKWARNHDWLAYKFSTPGVMGVPDRVFVSPAGRVCFIEFKAAGKRPTALQNKVLVDLQERHVAATWTDNVEDAIAWLQQKSGGPTTTS